MKFSVGLVALMISTAYALPLNPQPLPPGVVRVPEDIVNREPLNPQPLPPGHSVENEKREAEPLNPQPLPPGRSVDED